MEQRLASLEKSAEELKVISTQVQAESKAHSTALARLDGRFDKFDYAFTKIENALDSLADAQKESAKAIFDLREKVAHIDGRLNNIPTFWQTFSLMAMLLIGIAGLIFTASRFLHP